MPLKSANFHLTNNKGDVYFFALLVSSVTHLKADNPLYGSSRMDYAHIEQIIDFASMEVDANTSRWLYP
ncbi:unnamed protein product [Musa acuminata subsp. malaccensis]|uniref:(wild Malaysian banana) hypothetical protein n=1 Tax=Musa acuminata subsp. malaccensis TaxID=214687 RepID=A0A804K8H8_MUSAM|nr:unnamed protein product [Musa acuminata subsp. malaccensis]